MIQLEDTFDEGQNQDFFRVIAKHLARGERTLKRAFALRGIPHHRERYEAMLQDAAQDFWAAQAWGKIADSGGIPDVEQPIGVLLGGVDGAEDPA